MQRRHLLTDASATVAATTRIIPLSNLLWGADFPFRRGNEYVRQHVDVDFDEADLCKFGRDNELQLLPRWQLAEA